MVFLDLSNLMIYFTFLFIQYNSKLIGIEKLSSEKYFIALDSGIYLYNNDFTNSMKKIHDININNIYIIKHIYKNNIYIFYLIDNNLFLYIDLEEKFQNFISIANSDMIDYISIIPYNTNDNKLKIIIFLIDISKMNYYFYYKFYDVNFQDTYNNANLKQSYNDKILVISYLKEKKSLYYFLDSSYSIKCLYYDNKYFLNLEFDITKKTILSNFYKHYFERLNFIEFSSAKSDKDNYLICPLYKEIKYTKNYHFYYIYFTECDLCNKDLDFGNCQYISNSVEENCTHVKTYFYQETDKYGVVCQRFNELIFLIIDHEKYEVIDRKIIYINCTDNYEFTGEYSIIYNNSIEYYNLISEYNFTKNPSCFFEMEEEVDFQRNKTNSGIEIGQKEIFEDKNPFNTHYIFSDEAFSESELFNTDLNSLLNYSTNKSEENIIYSTENLIEENTSYINDFSEEISNSVKIYNNSYIDYITTKLIEKTDIVIQEGEMIIERTTINQTKEDFLNDMDKAIQNIEIGKNYEIKGNDFTITIKPTNTPPLPNTTHVEFDECEQILRSTYNISNTSIITFLQMEMDNDNNDALYKQIQYSTYDDQLKRLDLTVCKDVETKIHYMIKNDANLDLTKVSDYKKMGVDILNINDDFFTNLCYAFSSSDNDMILEDRIKYIFQNYSLCEEGCSYNNLDIITRSIACDCKIQGNISTITNPLVFDTGKETSFFDSNIGVSQCYNLVFSLNNKSKNIGFIVFCLLMLIYIIAILVQIKKGIKRVSDFLYKEMIKYGYIEQGHPNFFENNKIENNKIELSSIMGVKKFNEKIGEEQIDKGKKKFKKTGKKKFKKKKKGMPIKISQQMTLVEDNNKIKKNNYNNETKPNKIFKKKTKRIIEDDDYNNFGIIKINLDLDKKSYMPKDSNQSLLNYTFDEAVRYDRRNIIRVFYIYLLSKQIIFRTFLQKSPLEIFPIRLTLFIFMLSCDLALNALFYFNDNISKKYHYASNIFLFAFSNNITIILYSTLVSYFILTLLSKLSNSSSAIRNIFQKEEEKIKKTKKYTTQEQTKKNIFYEVENVLKKFKIKIFILLLIETIFILFFWYFVTAFCHVYSSTQTSWLLDTFLAILSRFVLEIIFGFIFAKLYRISVASNCETLYKILICIYDFS